MRRVARGMLVAAGVLVAFAALLVGGAALLLRTSWGSAVAARWIVSRANASLAGRLTLRRVVFGGAWLRVEGAELDDPDGAVVARVDSVRAAFSPFALLRREVAISELVVERPSLVLRQDARGWNLARAVASRGAPTPPSPPPEGQVRIDRLRVTGGAVDVRTVGPDARLVRASALSIDGAGRLASPAGDLEAQLRVGARLDAPLAAPLGLSVELGRSDGDARADVTVEVGGARVAARGRLDRDGAYRVDLEQAHLTAELVRAVVSGVRPRVPIDVRAALEGVGDRGSGRVDVAAARSRVHVEASWDGGAMSVQGLSAHGEHVDLGGALAGLPPSNLSFTLAAHAAGATLDTLAGALTLRVDRGALGGYDVGPTRLDARAARGALRIDAFESALPGLHVSANGKLTRARLALSADVRARDLAMTARSLRPLVSTPLAGAGRLRLRATGSWAHPAVALAGAFDHLEVAGQSARHLSVDAEWPDAKRLLAAHAALHAGAASLGGHDVRDVSASLESRGRDFRLAVGAHGTEGIGAVAAGRWSADRRALTLASLEVDTPEVTWRQAAGPIELGFDPPSLRGLDLRAGGQRLRADASLADGRVRASADISALELARLPRMLLPIALPVARVDLQARVDAPARWPPPPRAAASANVDLRVSDVSGVLPLAGVKKPKIKGALRVKVDLGGTLAAPRLTGQAQLTGASVDGQAIGDATVVVRGEDGQATSLSATLSPSSHGLGAGSIEISTPWSLARLERERDASKATPFEVTANLRDLSLAALSRLAGAEPLAGTLSVRASARGTATSPRGALNVEVRRASGPRFPATDARADVVAGDRDARFAVRLWRAADPGKAPARLLAWTSGVAKIPPSRLGDLVALERAPLEIRLGVGPIELEHSVPAGVPPLRARVHADGTIRGTLAAPVAEVAVAADPVALGDSSVGAARAEVGYEARRANVDATFTAVKGGALHLVAHAAADLGLPALLRGLDPTTWPLEANVEAKGFDLRWLPGLVPAVRNAAGALTASARIGGTIGAPRGAGRVEWTHGALTLSGLGAYEDVHLRAHADEDTVTVDELSAASLGGRARVTGSLSFAKAEAPVRLDAKLQRFPIYAQGRIVARVSTDLHAEGTMGDRTLEAHARIPDAHVELAKIEKRDLQPLDRPADVLLFDDGVPADGRARVEAPKRPFAARLVVDAPRNVWVKGDDANVELGFSRGFTVELGAAPTINGAVEVRRGRVDVIGRRFDLQAGSQLEFTGPPDKPVLDVTAKYVNDSANVTVLVTIKGPLDALSVNVSAPDRPDLTETQLYTLIVAGRLDLASSGGTPASSTSEAASLVGGALAGALQKVVAGRLPLDVFSFEAGDGLSGSRVEAGKNLGSRLYLGYVGRAGANPALLQNRNAVHLEYQFTSRWSLDAEYGDVGTGTADLFWTKRY